MGRSPDPIRLAALQRPGIPRTLAGRAAGPASEPPGGAQAPIVVQDGRLAVDVGSRIPAAIVGSGTWPEWGSRLAEMRQVIRDPRIGI